MAVRTPVYIDTNNNVKQMTSGEITEWVNQAVYQYSQNPSVTLSYVASGGNLTGLPLSDTRLQAGAASTSATSTPSEATTAEPTEVTVNYSRINQATASVTPTSDTGKTFPLYINASNNLQAMTAQDFIDTFIDPAIDLLVAAASSSGVGGTGGTYDIFESTSTTQGAVSTTLINASPIFVDTRADTSAYTAGGIEETLDQPTTITNYYLHRINGTDNTPARTPVFFDGSDDVKQYTAASIETLLEEYVRYAAVTSPTAITYNFDGTGTTRASLLNTRLQGGSGNYQTRFVNADDYRAQEFPDGTPGTEDTYSFKLNKS